MLYVSFFAVRDMMAEVRELGREFSKVGWGNPYASYQKFTEEDCLEEIAAMPPRFKKDVPGVSFMFKNFLSILFHYKYCFITLL